MKLLEKIGKKLGFGIGSMIAGLIALGLMNPAKGGNVVALVLGIYGILAGTHMVTDVKSITKTQTESDDA